MPVLVDLGQEVFMSHQTRYTGLSVYKGCPLNHEEESRDGNHYCFDATMMTQLLVIDNAGVSMWAILKCQLCDEFVA